MTNGSSQGLFVVVSVVIFGIFVAISYSLFRDQLTPSLASIFSDSIFMSDKQLKNSIASVEDLKFREHSSFTLRSRSKNEIEYSVTGEDNTKNIYLTSNLFDINKKYVFEYDVRLVTGEVISLGGHSAYLEGGTPLASIKNFYIDGVLVGNYYTGASLKMEKGRTYHIKVFLDSHGVSRDDLLRSSSLLYIQPNRSHAHFGGDENFTQHQTTPYSVNVSNLMLYEI